MLGALHLLQPYTERTEKHMSIEISGLAASRCRAEPGCHSSSSSFSSLTCSHPCVSSCMAKAWSPATDVLSFPLLTHKQPRCSASPFSPSLMPSLCCDTLFLFDRQEYGNLGRNHFNHNFP